MRQSALMLDELKNVARGCGLVEDHLRRRAKRRDVRFACLQDAADQFVKNVVTQAGARGLFYAAALFEPLPQLRRGIALLDIDSDGAYRSRRWQIRVLREGDLRG